MEWEIRVSLEALNLLKALSDFSFVFLACLAKFSPEVSLPNTEVTVKSYEETEVLCTYVCYDKFSLVSQVRRLLWHTFSG